jgi:hypothetical protein
VLTSKVDSYPDLNVPVSGIEVDVEASVASTTAVVGTNSTRAMFSSMLRRMTAEMIELFTLISSPQTARFKITLSNLIVTKAYHRDTIGRLIDEMVGLATSEPKQNAFNLP